MSPPSPSPNTPSSIPTTTASSVVSTLPSSLSQTAGKDEAVRKQIREMLDPTLLLDSTPPLPLLDDKAIEMASISGPPAQQSTLETMNKTTHNRTSLFDSFASSQRPILSPVHRQQQQQKHKAGISRDPERLRLFDLGYDQELDRHYDFWSLWALGLCNIGTFSGAFFGVATAISVGGSGMYSVGFALTGIFVCLMMAVVGEMASTYPVAGALLTYTFRLCRSSKRFNASARYLSWVVGSFLLCAHCLAQIVLTFQLARVVQSVVSLHVDYQPTFFETAGISWGLLLLFGMIVSSPLSCSPLLWKFAGGITIASWFITNVVLLTKAPEIRSAEALFTSYSNDTGFSSATFVCLIGWGLNCIATGAEACAHLAEDTIRPARNVPMAMFWSTVASYITGWVTICVFMSTARFDDLASTDAGNPAGLVNATLPKGYATLVLILLVFVAAFQNIAQLLSASRFLWALSRESALPFSGFFRSLSEKSKIPHRANWTIVLISAPALMLLRINSEVISLILLVGTGWVTIAAYFIPLLIYCFCADDALAGDGRSEWTLRSWSKPCAYIATGFCGLFLVVATFPLGFPVNSEHPENLPWSIVVGVGLLIISTIAWIFYGNARYAGPIKSTTRFTLGFEASLPTSTTSPASKKQMKLGATPSILQQTTSAGLGRSVHVFSSFAERSRDGRGVEGTMETSRATSEGEYTYDWEGEESRGDEHSVQ